MDSRVYDNYLRVVTDEDGSQLYDLMRSVRFPEKVLDVLYDVHIYRGEQWTKLSYMYYNTIDLYWVILAFNNIDDPFKELPDNTELKIPKPQVVKDVLSKLKSNS
jgi:hypothetical protein